jgi:hypothetical protein
MFRLRAIGSAVVLASSSAGQALPKPVADVNGRWELRGRWNSDDVSQIIELNSGWYSLTLVASVRLRYEYNGADLILTSLNAKGEPDPRTRSVLHVRFDDDTMTLTSALDTLRMLRASGGEFVGDIRGRWLMLNSDKEHPVSQEFYVDGSLRVLTTLSGEVGRYRVIGNAIEWSPLLPAGDRRRTNYKVEKEKLVLSARSLRDELIRLH